METPPSIMKIQAHKYNSKPDNQPPIFFNNNNNNTISTTTTSVMETPHLHNIRSSTPAFTQNLGSNDNSIIPIDISFSSYLKPPRLDDSEISIFDAQKYFNESNPDPKTRRWSAFSPPQVTINNDTKLDDHTNISRLSPVVDGYNRARSFHATPTASSEASWNSQTGLLSNPPGALAMSLRNVPSKPSKPDAQRDTKKEGISNSTTGGTKWFFRRKCPCSGKKSVQVEEFVVVSESKTMSPAAPYTKKQIPDHPHTHQNQNNVGGQKQETATEIPDHQQRLSSSTSIQENEHFPNNVVRQPRFSTSGRPLINDGGFSFPILLNPSSPQQSTLDDIPSRESLEVFQPVEEQLQRKSGGRGFGIPGTAADEDMASDASSDLFEIESFSTHTTSYPTYRRRDSLDEAHNFVTARRLYCTTRRSMDIAQTEFYEPSEARIDWSVTTAEGFERSSVAISASEVGEVSNGRNNSSGGGDVGRKKGNIGGGLLMSCKQEKALSVGPEPVKCAAVAGGGPEKHGGGLMGTSASTGAGKLPLMSTFMHVGRADGGSSNPNANTIKPSPIAPSYSAPLSLAFAA